MKTVAIAGGARGVGSSPAFNLLLADEPYRRGAERIHEWELAPAELTALRAAGDSVRAATRALTPPAA